MPDKRKHRGAHPEDRSLFGDETLPMLARAVDDLCWLIGRGYPAASSLKLVGDRLSLTERQRTVVARSACSETLGLERLARHRRPHPGEPITIDGYNIFTTIEAALAGGIVLRCRDGALRDMASMRGTWHKVAETERAVLLVLDKLIAVTPESEVLVLLDRPVSNSARFAAILESLGAARGVPWEVRLVRDPDPELIRLNTLAVSSDSAVLDGCSSWWNMSAEILSENVPGAWVLDFFKNPGT